MRRRWLAVLGVFACTFAFIPSCTSTENGGPADASATAPATPQPTVSATPAPVTVDVAVGETASFDFEGTSHEVTLLEIAGDSVRVALASSPTELVIGRGERRGVDLTDDAIPDAAVSFEATGGDAVAFTLEPLAHRVWDETGFEKTGGFRPYKHWNNAGIYDFSVVSRDDGYLLFYLSEDRRLNWERYDAAGALVTEPQLGVGVLGTGQGDERVTSVDAVAWDDGVAVASVTSMGLGVRLFDGSLLDAGQPLHVGRAIGAPALVNAGGRLFAVGSGRFEAPLDGSGPNRLIVTEIGTEDGLSIEQQVAVTEPTGRALDTVCDAAVDASSGLLLVLYKHRTTGEDRELRLLALDVQTLDTMFDALLAPAAVRSDRSDAALAASDGVATVVWRYDGSADGGQQLHVATVALSDGTVTRAWDGRAATASPRLAPAYPCEMLATDGDPALAYFDTQAVPSAPAGSPDRGRFVLWTLAEADWAASPLLLDGGKPKLADVLFDLNAFEQTPRVAILGAPVALQAVVENRGSLPANGVVVTASIGGEEVGTATLGNVAAASRVEFAVLWSVPPDLPDEQVTVDWELTTTSEQYTTGNDTTDSTARVRQKGLVTGRVVDASTDPEHGTGWYPGLANALVTVGDRTVLTDIAGFFALDDLPFGTYDVTVAREGYNPLSSQVTVSRTRPLAFVAAELDDHGVLRLRVVDEAGEPLEGVTVVLHDWRQAATTPESGELAYDMSARTYTFSFSLRGYYPLEAQEFAVVLGDDRTETVTLVAATTAFLGGLVSDRYGVPFSDATVTLTDATGTIVAQPTVGAGGEWGAVELPAKPPRGYTVTVTGGGLSLEDPMRLYGGDDLFMRYVLAPGRGELRMRSATDGYTSWMIHAGYSGFMGDSGADMYTWFGNYAISVGAQYWEGTDEISGVDVTVWGGTYETHATKSDIDFSGLFEGLFGVTDDLWDVTSFADLPAKLVSDHSADVVDLVGTAVDYFTADEEDPDEWVMTGQGNELMTWAEAQRDFAPDVGWDSSDPVGSAYNVIDAVPRSFAIPIVIGGSSVQNTAVRVDQVDVVRISTGEVLPVEQYSEWSSYQGGEDAPENQNGKSYAVTTPDVPYDDVVVYVWLTVQKFWHGTPYATCFRQRQEQVVIFHPGPQRLEGFIASGFYRDPSRLAR